MRSTIIRAAAPIAAVAVLLVGAAGAASSRHSSSASQKIKARVGAYMLAFTPKSGTIAVSHGGAVLQIRELGGNAKVNLLKSTKRITHSGTNWTLSGNAPWASFQLTLTASSPTSDGQPAGSALIGLTLKVTPRKDAPTDPGPGCHHRPRACRRVEGVRGGTPGRRKQSLPLQHPIRQHDPVLLELHRTRSVLRPHTVGGDPAKLPLFACRHQGVVGRRVPGLLRLRSAAQQSRLATPQEDDCSRFQLSLPRARDPVR